jgi:hypothetical protein
VALQQVEPLPTCKAVHLATHQALVAALLVFMVWAMEVRLLQTLAVLV